MPIVLKEVKKVSNKTNITILVKDAPAGVACKLINGISRSNVPMAPTLNGNSRFGIVNKENGITTFCEEDSRKIFPISDWSVIKVFTGPTVELKQSNTEQKECPAGSILKIIDKPGQQKSFKDYGHLLLIRLTDTILPDGFEVIKTSALNSEWEDIILPAGTFVQVLRLGWGI